MNPFLRSFLMVVLFAAGIFSNVKLSSAETTMVYNLPAPQQVTYTLTPSIELKAQPAPGPRGHVGVGAFFRLTADGRTTPYDNFETALQFEAASGVDLAYIQWFTAMGDSDKEFNCAAVRGAHINGMTPVINLEPWKRDFEHRLGAQPEYSWESINAGKHDDYFRKWFESTKACDNLPVILRFAHEATTQPGAPQWYPWQGDPAGFKAGWRRVVTIAREVDAPVKFLWSGIGLDLFGKYYYPGSQYVDIVGTTVLNHGLAHTHEWAKWRSFEEQFTPQYQWMKTLGKPIWVTEVGTTDKGGSKPAWVADMFGSISDKFPMVRGVLLLQWDNDTEYGNPGIDWRVDSSPESLAAFTKAMQQPAYSGIVRNVSTPRGCTSCE